MLTVGFHRANLCGRNLDNRLRQSDESTKPSDARNFDHAEATETTSKQRRFQDLGRRGSFVRGLGMKVPQWGPEARAFDRESGEKIRPDADDTHAG